MSYLKQYERLQADLASQIQNALEEDGLKQRELARRLGVTDACVSQMLRANGQAKNKEIKSMARIANALNRNLRISLKPKQQTPNWAQVSHASYALKPSQATWEKA